MQYNNDPIKRTDVNNFYVTYDDLGWIWKSKLNIREQYLEIKNEIRIRIQYDAKRNKSTIIVREKGKEKVKEVRNGLVLVNLVTDKGEIETSY